MNYKIKDFFDLIVNKYFFNFFGLKLSRNKGENQFEVMKKIASDIEIKIIIDGGAHSGKFCNGILSFFTKSTIHAFEPGVDNFKKLLKNTQNEERIVPHQYALGDVNTKSRLNINNLPETNSLLDASQEGEYYYRDMIFNKSKSEVEVITLSAFLESKKINTIDILKLDTQGYEMKALKGLGQNLKNIKIIYLEVLFIEIYKNAPNFSDIYMFLEKNNFTLYNFYDVKRSTKDGRILYADALFFNNEIDIKKIRL